MVLLGDARGGSICVDEGVVASSILVFCEALLIEDGVAQSLLLLAK